MDIYNKSSLLGKDKPNGKWKGNRQPEIIHHADIYIKKLTEETIEAGMTGMTDVKKKKTIEEQQLISWLKFTKRRCSGCWRYWYDDERREYWDG